MSPPPRPGRWAHALAWGLLLVALHQVHVFLSLTLAARDFDLWFFFSSDTVQYGLLYKDLFDLGFSYAGWNISHAPEYAQMSWALFLRALSSTLAEGHVLEALTQPVLLAMALHLLLRRALGRSTLLAPVVVTILLTMIARGIGLDLIAFIWSNRHGFTALIAVVALSVVAQMSPSRSRSIRLILLVGLGIASDLLFAVWFVAPIAAAILLLASENRRSFALPTLADLAAGLVLGLVVFWLATPAITVGEKLTIDLDRAAGSLARIADDARDPSVPRQALNALLGLGWLASALAVWQARRPESRLLALYAALLPLVTLAAMALTSVPFRESGYTRYLLGPELAALTILVVGASQMSRRFGEGLVLGAAALGLLAGYSSRPAGVPAAGQHYPPLVRCIDDAARKFGLRYGVADYWLSKYVSALSRTDLQVVSVTPRLDPFVKFSNIEWFLGGVGARRHDRPTYTFAILGAPSATETGIAPQALAALGEPAAVLSCYSFKVVVLPRGADQRIREQFAQNPRIREYYGKRGLRLPVGASDVPER